MADLNINFLGIKHKNPVVAGSGSITHEPLNMKKCIEAGASAVTTKSVSLDQWTWQRPRPELFFLDHYGFKRALAHHGFGFLPPDQGAEYIAEIKPLAEKERTVVVGSIALGNWNNHPIPVEEDKNLRSVAKKLESAGADILEVALRCPLVSTPSERAKLNKKDILLVINTLKGKLEVPILIKFAYTHDLFFLEDLSIMENMELEGMHVYGEIRGVFVDIEAGKPILPFPYLMGAHRTAEGSYVAYMASSNSTIPFISGVGMWDWRDVVERLMCGATLTAIHTAIAYNGYRKFTEMINGLDSFLATKGYKKVQDIIGIAVPHVFDPDEWMKIVSRRQVPVESVRTLIDSSRCTGCGRCVFCNQGAIIIKNDIPAIDLTLCNRCGACASICPAGAIIIHEA